MPDIMDKLSRPLIVRIVLVLWIFLLGLSGCRYQRECLISGRTMGTSYHIKYNVGLFFDHQDLKNAITKKLKDINNSMSTYDPKSEISTFNQVDDTSTIMPISDAFYQVMLQAQRLYEITNGAWDGTVKPIVNLWGFGHTSHPQKEPDSKRITSTLQRVGFQHIVITDHHLQKRSQILN
ncbi:MAG: ApbE family lipoprotein [Candidatus Magnetoglobus multicellularis str. Araruama]|uniref:FAD:protein FMN transferase n=1 Tax=Candidatus Magnetoglobus multicellularis str. Araruama TaxID=890399 RepID=A0A1V1PIY3_9BACT|nr:MAG: ApbE family lipoprotein [Candidatus Magnetoglobus multicellularis str. Araruama]